MFQKFLRNSLIFFLWMVAFGIHAHAGVVTDSLPVQKMPPVHNPEPDSFPRSISEIVLIGNKITKPSVIFRELTFQRGDTLDPAEQKKIFRRSEDNLMNTSLFNSAQITWLANDQKTMTVYILLTERWYIFPLPIFEVVDRNFNEWWLTKDFSKINYGAIVTWNNFRGRNETIGMTLRFGYTERISFFYSIPFISKKQKSGLSFAFAFSRNHATAYVNYDNDLVYHKDESVYSRKELSGSVQYSYRKGLYQTHSVEAGFRKAEAADTIVNLNPDFFNYGEKEEKFFSLRYIYKLEHRDLVAYPLHGSYFDVEIAKAGLPVFNDDINIAYIASSYKRYWQLSKKFYFSSAIIGKISDSNPQPFYNTGGLGFGSIYLRGYEYYVVLGQRYGLLKTNFKFELLPKHYIHAGFIPLEKFATIPYAFYFNLYGDAGYAEDKQYSKYNSLTNSWLYSGGAGIDLVTYYDLIFRLEYSINKFGESGIFLHFSAPI